MERYRKLLLRGFANAFVKKKLDPKSFEEMERFVREGRSLTNLTVTRRKKVRSVLSPQLGPLSHIHSYYRNAVSRAIVEAVKELEAHEKMEKLWRIFERSYEKRIRELREKIEQGYVVRAEEYRPLIDNFHRRLELVLGDMVWETIKKKLEKR